MTVVGPIYTARLTGSPDVPVTLRNDAGSIALDVTRAPHVNASVVLTVNDWALLDELDPRQNRRLVIDVWKDSALVAGLRVPIGSPRTFDLGIREARPNREAGTVTLTLQSDEALAGDFAQLTEDMTPFTLASSLRAIVNYVLNKVIPGAALEAVPANDADMTPYWTVTNLLRNPAVVTNLNNWASGGGCTIAFVAGTTSGEVGVNASAATGAVFAVDPAKYNIPATPGTRYTFELMQRNVSGGGGGYASLRFLDSSNATISEVSGAVVQMATTANQVSVTAIAPPSAVKVAPIWRFNGGSGRTYRLDEGLLHTSRFPVGYFSGGSERAGYTTSFEDRRTTQRRYARRSPNATPNPSSGPRASPHTSSWHPCSSQLGSVSCATRNAAGRSAAPTTAQTGARPTGTESTSSMAMNCSHAKVTSGSMVPSSSTPGQTRTASNNSARTTSRLRSRQRRSSVARSALRSPASGGPSTRCGGRKGEGVRPRQLRRPDGTKPPSSRCRSCSRRPRSRRVSPTGSYST